MNGESIHTYWKNKKTLILITVMLHDLKLRTAAGNSPHCVIVPPVMRGAGNSRTGTASWALMHPYEKKQVRLRKL
jgi:hypothetical protein